MKLSPLQQETLDFCKAKIDKAREIDNPKRKEDIEACQGIVYTQGGQCTIRTLKKLEKLGLIVVLEDNSGIGTSWGAFPSKIKVLNY